MIRLGYNTNGFPHHTTVQIAELLGAIGYDGIALTPDVFHLNPYALRDEELREFSSCLADHGLALAVETGARFLLDPARKHQPTLLSPTEGAGQRLDLLRRCFDLGARLGAETFSFWSGSPEQPAEEDELLERLCRGAEALLEHAGGGGPTICFEPEPGMFIDSLDRTRRFFERLARPELKLMLDVGHVPVTEMESPQRVLREWSAQLGGLQLDDSRDGVHEHLAPGEGELDFGAIFESARAAGFSGLASLELPRHGHDPVRTARRAYEALSALR